MRTDKSLCAGFSGEGVVGSQEAESVETRDVSHPSAASLEHLTSNREEDTLEHISLSQGTPYVSDFTEGA